MHAHAQAPLMPVSRGGRLWPGRHALAWAHKSACDANLALRTATTPPLAGGVAALLTLLIHEAGLPRGMGSVGCVTIGTAAVMSPPLAEACRPHVTSVILAADIIPHLSYASVETLLLELNQASLLPRAAKGLGKKLSSVLVSGDAGRWRVRTGGSSLGREGMGEACT